MTRTQNLLRTLLTVTPGMGARQIGWEFSRLAVSAPTRDDLAAIGGYTDSMGNWCLTIHSCDEATRWARGEALCALSYAHKNAGPEWAAARKKLLLGWAREDAKSIAFRAAA